MVVSGWISYGRGSGGVSRRRGAVAGRCRLRGLSSLGSSASTPGRRWRGALRGGRGGRDSIIARRVRGCDPLRRLASRHWRYSARQYARHRLRARAPRREPRFPWHRKIPLGVAVTLESAAARRRRAREPEAARRALGRARGRGDNPCSRPSEPLAASTSILWVWGWRSSRGCCGRRTSSSVRRRGRSSPA